MDTTSHFQFLENQPAKERKLTEMIEMRHISSVVSRISYWRGDSTPVVYDTVLHNILEKNHDRARGRPHGIFLDPLRINLIVTKEDFQYSRNWHFRIALIWE